MKLERDVFIIAMLAGLTGCSVSSDSGDGLPANLRKLTKAYRMNSELASQVADVSFDFHHKANFDSKVKGIYLSQATLENREYLQYLIERSQSSGINTFVIDLNTVNNIFEKNILLVKNSGIKYIARIAMFPLDLETVSAKSEAYWMSRYRLVEAAMQLGADEIQLDYAYYSPGNQSFKRNTTEVNQMLSWFKNKISDQIKLQLDLLGDSSLQTISQIDQHINTLRTEVDAICPMLYPSHFVTNPDLAHNPYDLVFAGISTIKKQFHNGRIPFKIYPYIELYNYRHSYNHEELIGYIHEQIRAVEDAQADGWFAWSATNKYDRLFDMMIDS